MEKNTIRLNESQLRQIVKESVKRALSESIDNIENRDKWRSEKEHNHKWNWNSDIYGQYTIVRSKTTGKFNYIDTDAELISDQWWDDCYPFHNGIAKVMLNGKYYLINTKGQIVDDKKSNDWPEDTYTLDESLEEFDWKSRAELAGHRYKQYQDAKNKGNRADSEKYYNSYSKLNNDANDDFRDEYVSPYQYDTFGDKLRNRHSATFNSRFDSRNKGDRMGYGAIKGRNKSGYEVFSTGKGKYYGNNGYTTPGKFFRDQEIGDKFDKANNELWNYNDDNYEYQRGKGWLLKNK